ncbi:oxygen-independent coproporphyrinogen III oxidase [Pelagicoccus sp. SDUM812005]|uniref:oxygen-independent coproporphyrinogen III oxidase n=1 Tax=Pelagicoccus sp. SDUM812005 TaxID=3041257 RepID=UPI00280D8A3E|nr:oxygen-independent coproporphyrinogen III oxidase [Pelagicoccus sp. SDUM812005]MDQ8179851.1 oxygen-independent coproporphyrinogen III oxidase [Pelagicoccus sp. SDUM812005]
MPTAPLSFSRDSLGLNPALIRKYNQPAPRYTSYPTALKFKAVEDRSGRSALLADLEDAEGPLSLYVHVPYCRSLCWFCGCAKVISTDTSLADKYLDYLDMEVRRYAGLIREGRKVVQLHFGGGSPNFLSPKQVRRLSGILRGAFEFDDAAEISVELDPRTLSEAQVAAFMELGVNRASIGVQDVNRKVQEAIHRIQPTETNAKTISWLRAAGIHSINVDLIYGLPYQTEESFKETLQEVLSYDPDRLAVFSYAHVPWSKPAQKILERSPLPDADSKIEILIQTVEKLTGCGYSHVGMDHFAKLEDPLVKAQRAKTLQRNFQGYSLHANVDICAFGMSAISQSQNAFRQNYKDLDTYYRMLDEGNIPLEKGYLLTRDDQVRREVIMRLMCDLELDFAERGAVNGIDFSSYFESEIEGLKGMESDGLVCFTEKGLSVTPLGRLLIRNVACRFDAYLGNASQGFSKAI